MDVSASQIDDDGVRLDLLDGFRLRCGQQDIELPSNAQRVLALLGLRHMLDRSTTAGTLWPCGSQRRACANLRSALWRINGILAGLIRSSHKQVALDPGIEVDVDRLVALASLLHAGDRRHASAGLLDLPVGELLPTWDDDWVLPERDRLRQVQLYALTDLARLCMTSGDFGAAVDAAYRALRLDALRESTYRVLVQTYVEAGDYAEALRCFDSYRRMLSAELSVAPSPQMLEIVTAIPRLPRGMNAAVTMA